MILEIEEARDILRIDGGDNDDIIYPLIQAIPPYLRETTGYASSVAGDYSPVARTAARFILQLWYYGDQCDTAKYGRVIDNLLKALSAERAMP